MQNDLVVAGHVCLDISPKLNERQTFEEVFCPGRLSLVGQAAMSTGGAVANTGLAAFKLGLNTVLMGKVGTDAFGSITRQILEKSGAKLALSVSSDVSSSYTIALNPAGSDRIFLHHSGANDKFYTEDLDTVEIKESKIFHFGYPPLMKSFYGNDGSELVKMMSKVKELGVITSLDMAMPDPSTESGQADWEKILRASGEYIDIFLPSYEELFLMLAKEEYLAWRNSGRLQELSEEADFGRTREFARRLQDYGMGIIVIKVGKNGIYLKTPRAERLATFDRIKLSPEWADRELWAESCRPSLFVSSTGAGDCAVAGFLAALIRGFDPGDALQLATIAGYQNLRAVDSVGGLGDWPELLKDLGSNEISHHELDLRKEGFKRMKRGLWSKR